jgi:hypothetical protein
MEISIQQIQSGNSKSFEQVYHIYHTRLYYYVLKHTRSTYLSEEAVQLTFIKMWENRRQLSPHFDLSVQLFRIARSITIDLLRKEHVSGRYVTVTSDESLALSVETDIIYKDELSRIEALIEGYPRFVKRSLSSADSKNFLTKRSPSNCPSRPKPWKIISGALSCSLKIRWYCCYCSSQIFNRVAATACSVYRAAVFLPCIN